MRNKFQLILASASPRRRELLGWTFLPFKIIPSEIEEVIESDIPTEVVESLAKQKAFDIWTKYPDAMVIGADTIVVNEGKILGKPHTKEVARQMLSELSGKSHDVYTGICILWQKEEILFHVHTKVNFLPISEDIMEFYLNTNESLDKAGAYGIQGAALSFIDSIEGSYSNVVGLPVDKVLEKIKTLLMNKIGKSWRECF